MIDRMTKLKLRRRVRRHKRQVEDISVHAEEHFERHFTKRLSGLWAVRRFLLTWLGLLILLIGGLVIQVQGLTRTYQTPQPAPGGIYTEGIIGTFTNANPLYATGNVDAAVSRLVFAGLFTFNENNQLVGDLAQRWSVDERGTVYTVTLRPELMWHDGVPLTAADVVFTYQTIQNADAKSPLQTSWQGIKVAAVNDRTVTFTLPSPLSAFPYSLTNGIVPKHRLDGVPMPQLRSVSFNTLDPVGAGPFQWEAVEVSGATPDTREQRIALLPFPGYHAGAPKLSRFIIHSFHDEKRLVNSFKNHEVTAMVGLEHLPSELAHDPKVTDYSLTLTSAVMAFFKNTVPPLNDVKVRRALVRAVNTATVIKSLGYPVVLVHEPLLKGQVGYNAAITQLSQDVQEAGRLLDAAGWKPGPDGLRTKDGKRLSFRLYSESTSAYSNVTQSLQQAWRAVGVDVQVFLQPQNDLQSVLLQHDYEALLYGISIGVDPDVFAYWHSSQTDLRSPNRLNLSEYKSALADRALEAGRTRSDPLLRTIKYKPFLEAWRDDAPALALYQPRLLYVTHGKVFGLGQMVINVGTDRFTNVQNWMIRQVNTNQ